MQRFLFTFVALVFLLGASGLRADDVLLTLDLRNSYREDPRSGGTWQLYARRVPNDKEPSGEAGIGYARAILANISSVGVKFADNIGQMQSGGPFVRALTNGAVEIIYQQDTAATVVEGVGIAKEPHRDWLIASGSWPAGSRPKFVADDAKPTPGKSEAKFFSKKQEIPRGLIPAGKTQTAIVTLGDLNKDEKVTGADIAPFVARLPGAAPALEYDPACDLDQSGTVTAEDKEQFIKILEENG